MPKTTPVPVQINVECLFVELEVFGEGDVVEDVKLANHFLGGDVGGDEDGDLLESLGIFGVHL